MNIYFFKQFTIFFCFEYFYESYSRFLFNENVIVKKMAFVKKILLLDENF